MGFFSDFKQGLYQGLTGNRGGSVDEAALKAKHNANAFAEALNYRGSAEQMAQELAGNGYTADPNWAPIDPNSQNHYIDLYEKLALMGHSNPEYAAKMQEIAYNQPELSPWITNDMKNAWASGYDINDPSAFNAYQDIDANRRATRVDARTTVNPSILMGGEKYADMFVDKDMLTKIKWKDMANNGKWPTYGDLQSGNAHIAEDPTIDESKNDTMVQLGGEAHQTAASNPRFNNPAFYKSGAYKMNEALKVLDPTESGSIANWLAAPDVRDLENKKRTFSEFGLRVASGGQVKADEYANWDIIFWPGPDAPMEEINSKSKLRALLLNASQQHSVGAIVGARSPRDFYAGKSSDGIDMFVSHIDGRVYKGNMVQAPSNRR